VRLASRHIQGPTPAVMTDSKWRGIIEHLYATHDGARFSFPILSVCEHTYLVCSHTERIGKECSHTERIGKEIWLRVCSHTERISFPILTVYEHTRDILHPALLQCNLPEHLFFLLLLFPVKKKEFPKKNQKKKKISSQPQITCYGDMCRGVG
jgi:hypothetical protein